MPHSSTLPAGFERRREDYGLITGHSRYVDDLKPADRPVSSMDCGANGAGDSAAVGGAVGRSVSTAKPHPSPWSRRQHRGARCLHRGGFSRAVDCDRTVTTRDDDAGRAGAVRGLLDRRAAVP